MITLNTKTLALLGGLLAGTYFLFTRSGKDLVEDTIGIDVGDILDNVGLGDFNIDDMLEDYGIGEIVEDLPVVGEKRPRHDVHFPIQDLYIPPNYYDVKKEIDTNRIPSKEFWDWYQKGSAGYLDDYYHPPHYWWNPDYYYYFGNLYKKWYPNIYDIKEYRPWRPADPLQGYYVSTKPQRQLNLEVRPYWEDDPTYS